MIKVKLYELDKHRNETTFRPLLFANKIFREVGIEFVKDGNADFAFVGQASFVNKRSSLEDSVSMGMEFLKTVHEPYFLFDGQDAATLIGSYEIFNESNALNMFKICMYKNRSDYLNGYVNGRSYWGQGDYKLKSLNKFNKILLSHTNWLSTIKPVWHTYDSNKQYDVSALFSANLKTTIEHGIDQSVHYNGHRQQLFASLDGKFKTVKNENGVKYSLDEYYSKMYNSKIILSPFGFGELPPRDLESCMFGSVLIRPDVSHIETMPNIYVPYETYVPCKHDFSDLNEKIDYVLSDYKNLQRFYVENMRKKYLEEYDPNKTILYYYNFFKTLKGVTTE